VTHRLLNLAVWLSLLLSVAAALMWVRSWDIPETWAFTPRPSGIVYAGTGWQSHREVGSADGCLVLVQYEAFDASALPPSHGYALVEDWTGTVRRRYLPDGGVSGRLPGVAEWYYLPGAFRPKRYVAVSWLAFVLAGVPLPLLRLWLRRRRASTLPAFPIVGV
jgi:hypothetical protein